MQIIKITVLIISTLLSYNITGQESKPIFSEDFEETNIDQLLVNWDDAGNSAGMSFSNDVPLGSKGNQSLMMTYTPEKNNGGYLYKMLPIGYDSLYARFYVKFITNYSKVHHFVKMGGYNPPTIYPQGGAGTSPKGDDSFITDIEPIGDSWEWDFYSYWMNMHGIANPKYFWGNTFNPNPPEKVKHNKWICVEMMMKVNDPVSASNGEQAFWIDGKKILHLGEGFPNGHWIWDKFYHNPDSSGFEGFRWRSEEQLKLNFFWLSYYMTKGKPGQIDKVLFDDVVVSTEYIGPHKKTMLPPKVNRVIPEIVTQKELPADIFYTQNFENLQQLKAEFHDTGHLSDSMMRMSGIDNFSGEKSLQSSYLPQVSFPQGADPGSSGWVWRFFGDNKLDSPIPIYDTLTRTRVFARWYHKFEEGFSSQEGTGTLPPKMARMRCFTTPWKSVYSILFWIEGKKGHISIQQHTRAPDVEREWLPNYNSTFYLNTPENLGRWIHFELGVTLGEGHHSDRIQAWADGMLICDLVDQDLAGGYRKETLNAMLWDSYWNGGAPRKESRYFDDLVLSSEPIGPARTSTNPIIEIAQSLNKNYLQEYQIEVAITKQLPVPISSPVIKQPQMRFETVWIGTGFDNSIVVNSKTGKFTGQFEGKTQLNYNTLYSVRLKQKLKNKSWSQWSQWHATFATQWTPDTAHKNKKLPKGYLIGHKIKNR